MASEKKITMREYNGTDYDTLYPKTIAEQVDGVYSQTQIDALLANKANASVTFLPDATDFNSILQTGSYKVFTGLNTPIGGEGDAKAYMVIVMAENENALTQLAITYYQPEQGNRTFTRTKVLGSWSEWKELATKNIVPSLAIGSYVGTGTYGPSNPNTLTFDFEPKIVFLSVDSNASAFSQTGFMFFIRNQSGSPSWYYYNSAYVGRTITWSGNTLSWYTLAGNPNDAPDRQQFNVSGQRYCYVALG